LPFLTNRDFINIKGRQRYVSVFVNLGKVYQQTTSTIINWRSKHTFCSWILGKHMCII